MVPSHAHGTPVHSPWSFGDVLEISHEVWLLDWMLQCSNHGPSQYLIFCHLDLWKWRWKFRPWSCYDLSLYCSLGLMWRGCMWWRSKIALGEHVWNDKHVAGGHHGFFCPNLVQMAQVWMVLLQSPFVHLTFIILHCDGALIYMIPGLEQSICFICLLIHDLSKNLHK